MIPHVKSENLKIVLRVQLRLLCSKWFRDIKQFFCWSVLWAGEYQPVSFTGCRNTGLFGKVFLNSWGFYFCGSQKAMEEFESYAPNVRKDQPGLKAEAWLLLAQCWPLWSFMKLQKYLSFDLTVGLNWSIFWKLEIFIKSYIRVIFRCLNVNVLLWLGTSQTIPHHTDTRTLKKKGIRNWLVLFNTET